MLAMAAGRAEALTPPRPTLRDMATDDVSCYVRLQVEMVLEISDAEALMRAAVAHVSDDDSIPDGERAHAVSAVSAEEDGAAEAIAYLVEPIDLVSDVPGVELAQASWSSETIDYDADGEAWHLGSDDLDSGNGQLSGRLDRFDADARGGPGTGSGEFGGGSREFNGNGNGDDNSGPGGMR